MKLIFFDFDGVLANTHIMCFEMHQELNPDIKWDFFQSLSHGNFWELYNRAVSDNKIKHNSNFQNMYNERIMDLKMPENLKKSIIKLSEKYTLHIISSTSKNQIIPFLQKESILDKFKSILGRDTHTSKVEKIKNLLGEHKISPKDAIFVTDTTGDIIEARECGVQSFGVTWGLHDREYLLKEKPLALVNTPEELEEKIEDFLK